MASPLGWLRVWFVVSGLICTWDASFVLLRPLSFAGGPLAAVYSPYVLYITIDKLYGNMSDGFVRAQSWMNLAEVVLGFTALALQRSGPSSAVVLALVVLVMQFWKTVAYMLSDVIAGYPHTGHNDMQTWLSLYLLPNCVWILVPAVGILSLAPTLQLKREKTA